MAKAEPLALIGFKTSFALHPLTLKSFRKRQTRKLELSNLNIDKYLHFVG